MSHKGADVDWNVLDKEGNIGTWERAQLAVLMDVRRELKSLNALLHCYNFQQIPHKLERISRNTAKPKMRNPKVTP